MACGQWWCLLLYQNINGGTFLGHVGFPGPHILYCCNTTWYLIGFCWWMWMSTVLHCLALHHAYGSCHPLLAIIRHQDQHLTHEGYWCIIKFHTCFLFDYFPYPVTQILVHAIPHPVCLYWWKPTYVISYTQKWLQAHLLFWWQHFFKCLGW